MISSLVGRGKNTPRTAVFLLLLVFLFGSVFLPLSKAFAIDGLPAAEDIGGARLPELATMPWEDDLSAATINGYSLYTKTVTENNPNKIIVYTPTETIEPGLPWSYLYIEVMVAPPTGYIVLKKVANISIPALPYDFRYTATCVAGNSGAPCATATFRGSAFFNSYLETHTMAQCNNDYGATPCSIKYAPVHNPVARDMFANNVRVFDDEAPFLSAGILNVITTKNIGLDLSWDVNTAYSTTIVSGKPEGSCPAWDIGCNIGKIFGGIADTFKAVGEAILHGITYLFIPDFSEFNPFENIRDTFLDKLGFLSYPFTFLNDLFTAPPTGSCTISSCVRNYGAFFNADLTYDFATVSRESPTVWGIVKTIAIGFISLGVIMMLYRKIIQILDGDDHE